MWANVCLPLMPTGNLLSLEEDKQCHFKLLQVLQEELYRESIPVDTGEHGESDGEPNRSSNVL